MLLPTTRGQDADSTWINLPRSDHPDRSTTWRGIGVRSPCHTKPLKRLALARFDRSEFDRAWICPVPGPMTQRRR